MGQHHHSQQGGSVELTHTAAGASTRITVTGGTQESSCLPPLPPPLVHCPSLSPQSDSPFELALLVETLVFAGAVDRDIQSHLIHLWTSVFVIRSGRGLLTHVEISNRITETFIITVIFLVSSHVALIFDPKCWISTQQSQCSFHLCMHTEYLIKQMPGRFNH